MMGLFGKSGLQGRASPSGHSDAAVPTLGYFFHLLKIWEDPSTFGPLGIGRLGSEGFGGGGNPGMPKAPEKAKNHFCRCQIGVGNVPTRHWIPALEATCQTGTGWGRQRANPALEGILKGFSGRLRSTPATHPHRRPPPSLPFSFSPSPSGVFFSVVRVSG
jgi:hypothetical protein